MQVTELCFDRTTEINTWFYTNLTNVRSAMMQALKARANLDTQNYEAVSECFKEYQRTLSEMPICAHVWNRLDPPPGYEIVPWEIGRVNIIGPRTGLTIYSCNHSYARNDHGVILCLTPGLFEAFARTDLGPGGRLQRLRDKAPDLISLYPDNQGRMGIGTLVGSREEIAKRLSLDYTTVG